METNIFDAHNDCATAISDNTKLKNYYQKMDNVNAKCISAIWTTEMNPLTAINEIKNLISKIEVCKPTERNFGIEDCGVLSDFNICEIINLKPTYISLTWNYNNRLAGGALETGNLTKNGKFLVKLMQENNIIVDLAHLNQNSFFDVANMTNNPLFCSHTAFNKICANNRNLKFSQIKEIVESNGLVGLCLVGKFLTNNECANIEDVVKHIMYFLNNFGDKNLCLGTDFYGTTNLPTGISDYKDLIKIKKHLIKLGVNDFAIENIFYNNLNNFLIKNFEA